MTSGFIFIDSLVFIATAKQEDEFKFSSERLLKLIDSGKYQAYASSASLLELSYVLKRLKFGNEQINRAIHSALSISNLTFLPITSGIIKQASDLVLTYKSGLHDSIIASTMVEIDILNIVSEDRDYDAFPFIKRLKIRELL